MLQKTPSARAGDEPNEEEFRRCYYTHKRCPRVVTGPENAISQVERRHSHAAPGIGGRVCVLVGNEDGNRIFFSFFEK